MKKHFLLVSMITALLLSGCQLGGNSGEQSQESSDESQSSLVSSSDNGESSSQEDSSSGETPIPYDGPKQEGLSNDNFTLTMPTDVSMMSANCKQYVDDMKAQQQRLIAQNGADSDYYINDLGGSSGVDITKGVASGDNGGYRDGKTQNDYLDAVDAEWEKGEKSDENKGIELVFAPSDSLKNKEYTVYYSVNSDMSNAKTIKTSETSICIKNLLVNQKYYVSVSADGKYSNIANFETGDYPRWIDARPMFNVRDHGGYMTSSGQRIKQGLVYRGGEITPIEGWKSGQQYTGDVGGRYTNSSGKMQDGHITTQTEASKKVFRDEMGMVNGLEIDLRSGSERGNPSYQACGFAENGDIDYALISISSYANGLNNNKAQIKQVFEAFAEVDKHPVYYHCYGGADRTGTVGFLLGAVLGMSYTDLVIDFELTSYSSNPSRNYRSHLRNGPYNKWPEMVNTLKSSFGFSSTKTIKQAAEDYLKNQCNVSQSTIDTIREIMLEPAQ